MENVKDVKREWMLLSMVRQMRGGRRSAAEAGAKRKALPAPPQAAEGTMLQFALKLLTLVSMAACIMLGIWGWRQGLFTSKDALQEWVSGFGIAAPLVFILFQVVQVVIPILPGGVSLAGGVVLFGPWWGFVCNYVGVCLGSLIVFEISRRFGKPLLYKLFPAKALARYESWTGDNHRFAKLFAIAIFAPCAPDDMLCYLAGTTGMSRRVYTLIILLGKPASTALYSLGLTALLEGLTFALSR